MPSFVPPTVLDVPTVFAHDKNRYPWAHYRAGARGVNVYKLLTGTYTQIQPDDPATIAITYLGAHNYTITAAEATALTAAGYTTGP